MRLSVLYATQNVNSEEKEIATADVDEVKETQVKTTRQWNSKATRKQEGCQSENNMFK